MANNRSASDLISRLKNIVVAYDRATNCNINPQAFSYYESDREQKKQGLLLTTNQQPTGTFVGSIPPTVFLTVGTLGGPTLSEVCLVATVNSFIQQSPGFGLRVEQLGGIYAGGITVYRGSNNLGSVDAAGYPITVGSTPTPPIPPAPGSVLSFFVDVASTSEDFIINQLVGPTAFTIDWGDGNVVSCNATISQIPHTYSATGIKTVTLTADAASPTPFATLNLDGAVNTNNKVVSTLNVSAVNTLASLVVNDNNLSSIRLYSNTSNVLTQLNCSNNSNLISLDVANLGLLVQLQATKCGLSTLTLGSHQFLTGLLINSNSISSVGVNATNTPILSNLNIAVNPNLSGSLNLSNMLALTNIVANGTGLSSINVGNCGALSNFIAFNSSNLSSITFNNNALLQTLEAQNCSLLTTGLTTLTSVTATTIRSISLNRNRLTGGLTTTFSGMSQLQYLDCSCNSGVTSVTLTGANSLGYVNLSNCGLTGLTLPIPAATAPFLSTLYTTNNTSFTNLTITGLSNMIFLNASNCGITNAAATYFINNIFVNLSNYGKSNGTVNLAGGSNATPTNIPVTGPAGLAARNFLSNTKGWTTLNN